MLEVVFCTAAEVRLTRVRLGAQGNARSWAGAQKERLDSLLVLSKDTAALLTAAADTGSAAPQRAGLAAAAAAAHASVAPLLQCRSDWDAQFGGSAADSALLVTPVSVGVLESNAEVRSRQLSLHRTASHSFYEVQVHL